MPLPPPATGRQHVHTRTVTCRGYRRDDGLWDIEGHLVDAKTYDFHSDNRGQVTAGTPVHEMWVRLTLDDTLTVQAIQVVTDAAPTPVCPDIAPAYDRLVGLRIASGWTNAVRERVGGVAGCTHLTELMGPVATTAFQTIFPILSRERKDKESAPDAPKKRPLLLDSCHAFANGSPVTRHLWPDFYTGPATDG